MSKRSAAAASGPRCVHAGYVKYELPDGTVRFVERAHPWRWAKAQHRHNEWLKKKNNKLLLKGAE